MGAGPAKRGAGLAFFAFLPGSGGGKGVLTSRFGGCTDRAPSLLHRRAQRLPPCSSGRPSTGCLYQGPFCLLYPRTYLGSEAARSASGQQPRSCPAQESARPARGCAGPGNASSRLTCGCSRFLGMLWKEARCSSFRNAPPARRGGGFLYWHWCWPWPLRGAGAPPTRERPAIRTEGRRLSRPRRPRPPAGRRPPRPQHLRPQHPQSPPQRWRTSRPRRLGPTSAWGGER